MSFVLHSRLQQDCFDLGEFSLCRLLLMNDSQYPWFVLVPQIEGIKELHELSEPDQHAFMTESSFLSRALVRIYAPDKLNVAALGNVVPQLHVHHIVRFATDPAWPAPIWGKLLARPYDDAQRERTIESLRRDLAQMVLWNDG